MDFADMQMNKFLWASVTRPSSKPEILILFIPAKYSCTLGKLLYICDVGEKQKYRTIIFYKDYFQTFFDKQNKKVKAKIVWTFDLVEDLERVPETYLKHIDNTDGLYEIRVQLGSDIFRIFCFFDKGQLVVLANGFQKKTQKTPTKEIEMALKIKEAYELEITNSINNKK